MLTFRNVNFFFIALLLLSLAADKLYGISVYTYIILLAVYGLILFYGCYDVGSNFFIPIVCSLKTDKKIISISFDDGPDAVNSPLILALLKENNIEAVFFCIGERIAGNEAILKQVDTDGHIIGNHTYSHHYWFDLFSANKMAADIQLMDKTTGEVTGKTPKLFRPPYGVTNPNLKKAIINGNYTPVGWSVRSFDTVIKDENRLLNKLIKKLKPGAIFLFHDTSKTTLAILPAFLNHVKSSGYEIIRLDKMLNLQPYA
jgi:peptidoglycan/xylan/chitin deacetylase (PgdA/CDA1 family)